jgi:hypothetical protein
MLGRVTFSVYVAQEDLERVDIEELRSTLACLVEFEELFSGEELSLSSITSNPTYLTLLYM